MEGMQMHDDELALSAFRKVAGALGLTPEEQAALSGPDLDHDRLALLVGIYDLAVQVGGERWLRCPNTAATFGGLAPLDLLTRGGSPQLVFDYLQAALRTW